MPYHGLLDWRLGIALFRVMVESSYQAGADGNFGYPELKGWTDTAKERLVALNEGFYNKSFELGTTPNGIPFLYDPSGNRKPIFASHPLWSGVKDTQILGDAVLEASREINNKSIVYDEKNVIVIDTFNLLRRTSNCYEYIQNKQREQ